MVEQRMTIKNEIWFPTTETSYIVYVRSNNNLFAASCRFSSYDILSANDLEWNKM